MTTDRQCLEGAKHPASHKLSMLTQGYDPPKAWKPTTQRQKWEDQKFKATLRYLQFEAYLEKEEEREGRRGRYLRVHQNLEHKKKTT